MDYKSRGCIDLHIHSTASDGSLTPAEIIGLASRIGLQAISITDHDTLEGTRQALESHIPPHLEFISGIELSVAGPADGRMKGGLHILGYGIDPTDTTLRARLAKFRKIRAARSQHIVRRLNALGLDLTMEQVGAEVGEASAGRPHIANAMVRAGLVADINDAFGRYLGVDRPAYVGKERIPYHRAFELIQEAGGIAVLAHPYLVKCRDDAALKELLGQLRDAGLQGLEVYYPQHTPKATARYLKLAKAFNLLVTGGTDFHGEVTPEIEMGCGSGNLCVPYDLYARLLASLPKTEPI